MKKKVLREFIDSNKSFYSKNKRPWKEKSEGKILVDLQTTDVFVASSLMKLSVAVSKVLNRDIVVISAIRATEDIIELIKSYIPLKVISAKNLAVSGFLFNLIEIIKMTVTINTGDDLVSLEIKDMPIGIHIYDLILKRMSLTTIDKLSLRHRLYLIIELSFYYSILKYINRNNISYAILPDNVYRQGLIFEILRIEAIPSIAGIDINGIAMHKYESAEDYKYHCRVPDELVLQKILSSSELYQRAEDYLAYRISGKENQHDVVRAYASGKRLINRSTLINDYDLDPKKKIVVIMAHIFCDAPHAYPNMLFKDYEAWLIKTCLKLSKNPYVNFLVKEHPSAKLYNEQGKIDMILDRYDLKNRLISSDINTRAFFDSVDAIVTCGGTAGMEFSCFGVPVLVAAKSPYASFPYIKSPDTLEEYYSELDTIHKYEKLEKKDIRLARCVLFVILSVMKIEKNNLGLGSQEYARDNNFNNDLFMEEMIADCENGTGYSTLVSVIERFLQGDYNNLMSLTKLDT